MRPTGPAAAASELRGHCGTKELLELLFVKDSSRDSAGATV